MNEKFKPTLISKFAHKQEKQHREILTLVQVPPATDAQILTYLRRSAKLAEIAALAERDELILAICEQLGIIACDAEWQAAGDAFRIERQIWGTSETLTWLKQQRIRVQDWSQGIRITLLEKKLKEHLFGTTVDSAYISNQEDYRRVALWQILVFDLTTADKIVQILLEESVSFCTLAWEYSQDKLSQKNGGFAGIHCLLELSPEIRMAITEAQVGEIIGPIATSLGYHLLKVEKWFPAELNQSVREQIMNTMFDVWLSELQSCSSVED